MKLIASITLALLAGYTLRALQDLPATVDAEAQTMAVVDSLDARELIGAGIATFYQDTEADEADLSAFIADVIATRRETAAKH